MIYWLGVNIVLLALFIWACWAVNHAEADNFGAAFPVIILAVVGGLSWLAYLVTAFWLHHFI